MKPKVRWGILSAAGIAREQVIPALKRANNVEIVAIASRSGNAKETANMFNIENVYDNYQQLLDDREIDAVYIPLPNHLHKEWAIKAAEKKKHILCEKPAALTAADIIEIKQACNENNVFFMEAFMYYFHPQHERVRELLSNGEIGEVKQFRGSFSFLMHNPEENIRMSKDKGGGSLYDIGCYPIHAMRNIIGQEPESVRTEAVIDPKYNVEISSISHFEFASGIIGIIDSSFAMTMRDEYEVIGTKGRISVPYAFRPDIRGNEGLIIIESGGKIREERLTADIYRSEVEHFSASIQNQTEPALTFDNTHHNMRAIDACIKSIETNQRVHV